MKIIWGAVNRPKQNQEISGDTYVVKEFAPDGLMVAVIDGLGGGEEAARAALGAAEIVQTYPDYPLEDIIRRAHSALHNTRGAVIALLRLNLKEHKASYIGVGNIGIYVQSTQPIKPISKNGILGYRLPPALLQLHYPYNLGDTFVLYSDGISSRFALDGKIDTSLAPQAVAETILANYGKTIDDATVVVVRDD